MASFDTLARWERYVPTLSDNPTRARPFYLRLAAGLTIEDFRALRERLASMEHTPAGMAAALQGVAEMGDEPLEVGGKPIATLPEYLALIAHQRGGELAMELVSTLTRLNTTEGARELFSARLSGGSATTPHAPETADAQNGRRTSPSSGPRPPKVTPPQASADGQSTSAAPSAPVSEGTST